MDVPAQTSCDCYGDWRFLCFITDGGSVHPQMLAKALWKFRLKKLRIGHFITGRPFMLCVLYSEHKATIETGPDHAFSASFLRWRRFGRRRAAHRRDFATGIGAVRNQHYARKTLDFLCSLAQTNVRRDAIKIDHVAARAPLGSCCRRWLNVRATENSVRDAPRTRPDLRRRLRWYGPWR